MLLRRTAVVSERMWVGGKAATRTFTLALLAVMVGFLVLVMAARPAHAVSTFTVNSTANGGDATPDGVCDSNPIITRVTCTLREAIQEANDTPNSGGPDLIKFSIPGDGPHIIKPASELPEIAQPVTIDGYTEGDATTSTPDDDAKENTLRQGTNAVLKVELSGENAGEGVDGLTITGGGTTIRGLAIYGFKAGGSIGAVGGSGIFLRNVEGNTNNVIEGNFIGVDAEGTTGAPGNERRGLFTEEGDATTGNVIGTDADGVEDLAERNLISGNGLVGMQLNSDANTVRGNLVGTDRNGADGSVGNGHASGGSLGAGILIASGGSNDVVSSNTIAFNTGPGVAVLSTSTNNDILRNSIFSNGGLGIDLGDGDIGTTLGATANDGGTADDSDTGPNGLQNKPVLTSAVTSSGTTTIEGVLDTKPNQTQPPFTVQFFSQPSGNEGKKFIGQKQVPTDSDGRVTFSFTPPNAVAVGQKITATATGAEGTSEFSAPVEAVAAAP